jgi:hypothetical protein
MFGRGKRAKAQNLMQNGAKGIGTVLNVQDTGVTFNDNPRVKLTFQIDPLDGRPGFQAEKTATVSRVAIPRIGDRYACWYDPTDPSTWAFATLHDAEGQAQIRSMFGAAAESLTGMSGGAGPVAAPVATAAPPAGPGDPVERLRKLGELRQAGVLSEAEFAAKKAEILGEI